MRSSFSLFKSELPIVSCLLIKYRENDVLGFLRLGHKECCSLCLGRLERSLSECSLLEAGSTLPETRVIMQVLYASSQTLARIRGQLCEWTATWPSWRRLQPQLTYDCGCLRNPTENHPAELSQPIKPWDIINCGLKPLSFGWLATQP